MPHFLLRPNLPVLPVAMDRNKKISTFALFLVSKHTIHELRWIFLLSNMDSISLISHFNSKNLPTYQEYNLEAFTLSNGIFCRRMKKFPEEKKLSREMGCAG